MKRVLLLGNHDVVLYNFRLEVIEALLAEGNEVFLSSPYGERIDDLVRLGCHFHEIEISRHGMNPFEDLKLIKAYQRLIDEVKPDIVFSYTIKPNLYGAIACRSRNIPIVANITGLGTAVEQGGFSQLVAVLLYKYAFTKVQKVFFQNSENRQFFIDHKLALGKHDLLPGSGVNLERFPALEYPKDDIVRFVFIARIMKEKGIDSFLESARFIKAKYPNTEFHVCGFIEGTYRGDLAAYAKDGTVIYHGMVRNIKEMHRQMHCTVFPSYYPEGLSNGLLEAAACARPIITTDRSGCREAVDDGISGIIVPLHDQEALNAALETFMAMSYEEKKAMGQAGRDKMEREFNRQIVVGKYLKELR